LTNIYAFVFLAPGTAGSHLLCVFCRYYRGFEILLHAH